MIIKPMNTPLMSGLAALMLSSAVSAEALGGERDAEGIFKEPLCQNARIFVATQRDRLGSIPTGIKASSQKWDMEIFEQTKDARVYLWSLVAKSKDGSVPAFKSCELDLGFRGEYRTRPWFPIYFKEYMGK